ncbi:MAG: NUDIX hydrolase [Desulfosoma sp.]
MTDRKYPDRPLVGVGAVVFRNDEVLLVQRGREPAYGLWSLPGGLVKVGESLEAAVRREVLEETGVLVKVLDVIACLDRVIADGKGRIAYHYVLVDFLCELVAGEPKPGSDVLACAYVAPENLPGLELTRGAAEVIRRATERRRAGLPPVYDPLL